MTQTITFGDLMSVWAEELLADPPIGPVLALGPDAAQTGLFAVRDHPGRRLVHVRPSEEAAASTGLHADAAGLGDRLEARHGDPAGVLGQDERFALVIAGAPDGLDVARACVRAAAPHLVFGGAILLQLGSRAQASTLAREAAGLGLALADLRTSADGVVALFRPEVSPFAVGYC